MRICRREEPARRAGRRDGGGGGRGESQRRREERADRARCAHQGRQGHEGGSGCVEQGRSRGRQGVEAVRNRAGHRDGSCHAGDRARREGPERGQGGANRSWPRHQPDADQGRLRRRRLARYVQDRLERHRPRARAEVRRTRDHLRPRRRQLVGPSEEGLPALHLFRGAADRDRRRVPVRDPFANAKARQRSPHGRHLGDPDRGRYRQRLPRRRAR